MLPRIKVYEVWKDRFEVKAPIVGEKWTPEKLAQYAIENGLNGICEVFWSKEEAYEYFMRFKSDCNTRFFHVAGMRFIQFDYLCINEAEYEEDVSVNDIEWVSDLGIVEDYVAGIKED